MTVMVSFIHRFKFKAKLYPIAILKEFFFKSLIDPSKIFIFLKTNKLFLVSIPFISIL